MKSTAYEVSTVIEIPPYAGGSYGVTHVDRGMLQYFRNRFGCDSLLDVGCGPGGQVKEAKLLGYRALGLEIDPTFYRAEGVALINLCDEPAILPTPADLVWSCEVAEHLPEDCVANFLRTLTENSKMAICLTANVEPLPGHLTLRSREWWIEQVTADSRWVYDLHTADIVAKHSTMEREFLRETGMIFWRNR